MTRNDVGSPTFSSAQDVRATTSDFSAASQYACRGRTVGKSMPSTVGSRNLARLGALNRRDHWPGSVIVNAGMIQSLYWARGHGSSRAKWW